MVREATLVSERYQQRGDETTRGEEDKDGARHEHYEVSEQATVSDLWYRSKCQPAVKNKRKNKLSVPQEKKNKPHPT